MIQYASRAQLKEKARDQMAGHYGNAILLSICRSLIVFSLTFCRQHDLHYDPYRTDTYGGKRRDISAEYLLLYSLYDFIVRFSPEYFRPASHYFI